VAKQWVEFKSGRDHLIRKEEGVEVTGRIERDGKPLKDVVVALVTADRACGNFFRCDEPATDEEGRFLIPNVPPDREFVMYGKMDSMAGRGVVPSKTFRTGKSGTSSELKTIAVRPGFGPERACRLIRWGGGPVGRQNVLRSRRSLGPAGSDTGFGRPI
jgi:hypothetical protein